MNNMPSVIRPIRKSILLASLTLLLAACGGGGSSGGGNESSQNADGEHSDSGSSSGFTTSTAAATNAVAGQSLYAAYCSTCHGATYAEAKDYASTLSAIARNKGGMGYLSGQIQTSQANDIATYLTFGVTSAGAPTTPTTPTLISQSIAFGSPADQVLGSTTAPLVATASSGLTVSFASNTPTVCLANGTVLDLLSVGTCSLTASQFGDASYAAATPVTVSFAVTAAAGPTLSVQTISFASPGNMLLDASSHPLVASASSGLQVSFASGTPAVCRVSGAVLTLHNPGTCTVLANQAGDATYAAAATVSNSFYAVASNAASGKTAYNQVINGQSCAACHGAPGSVATSRILAAANADVVLNSAILNNIGGMGVLNGLYTSQQILDISAYLATPGL